MKIPLVINDDQLELAALIHAPRYRTGIAHIEFIIDTGSQRSFIGYGDAIKLHFPLNKLELKEHMQFGGTKFGLYKIKATTISLLTDDRRAERLELGEFHIAKPTKAGHEKLLAEQLPSIIGLDFLLQNNLALYVNPGKNIAYLEK